MAKKRTIAEQKQPPEPKTTGDGKETLSDPAYLKKWILDCKKEAENATDTLRKKWQELWQIYQNMQDYEDKKEWQSQTCIPKLFMAVERSSLFIERATLQTSKLFHIELDDEFILPLKEEIRQAKKQLGLMQKRAADVLKTAKQMLDSQAGQQPTPDTMAAIELMQSQITKADEVVQTSKQQLEQLQDELNEYEQQAKYDDLRFKAHLKKTNFVAAFGEMIKGACLLGLGAVKRSWNRAKKRLLYENTDVQNLYIAPEFMPFQDENPRYVIEYKEMDLAKLIEIARDANKESDSGNEHAKDAPFDMAEIKKIQETYSQKDEREDRMQREGLDTYTPVSKKVGILEFWGDVVSKDGRETKKGVLVWLANEKYLIRNHPNGYKDAKHPWDFWIPMVYPHRGVAGTSMVEAEVKLQYTLNNLLNLFIDNLTFSVNTMYQFKPQDLMEPQNMTSIYPGKLIKLKPGAAERAVFPVEKSGIGADAFRVFDMTEKALQENTAITEFLTAMPSGAKKTLGEIEIKTQESHGYFDVIARKLEVNSIAKLLYNSYEMLEQFTDTFSNLERYQFNVGGLSLLLLRKEMVEYLMQALSLALKNPQIAAWTNLKDLWERLLGIWGLDEAHREDEPDKIVPPMQQPQRPQLMPGQQPQQPQPMQGVA